MSASELPEPGLIPAFAQILALKANGVPIYVGIDRAGGLWDVQFAPNVRRGVDHIESAFVLRALPMRVERDRLERGAE